MSAPTSALTRLETVSQLRHTYQQLETVHHQLEQGERMLHLLSANPTLPAYQQTLDQIQVWRTQATILQSRIDALSLQLGTTTETTSGLLKRRQSHRRVMQRTNTSLDQLIDEEREKESTLRKSNSTTDLQGLQVPQFRRITPLGSGMKPLLGERAQVRPLSVVMTSWERAASEATLPEPVVPVVEVIPPGPTEQNLEALKETVQQFISLSASSSANEKCNAILKVIQTLMQCTGTLSNDTWQLVGFTALLSALKQGVLDSTREVRAHTWRLLRFICQDQSMTHYLSSFTTLMIRALTKDNAYDMEREQCLKLVRQWLEWDHSLPSELIAILSALTEQADDRLRLLACETLCELFIHQPNKKVLHVLMFIVLDKAESIPIVMPSVIYVLDREPASIADELDVLLAPLTENSQDPVKLNLAVKSLTLLLCSWPGFIYFYRQQRLAHLMAALKLPFEGTRSAILDLLESLWNQQQQHHQQQEHLSCLLWSTLIQLDLIRGLLDTLLHCSTVLSQRAMTILKSIIQFILPPSIAQPVEVLSLLLNSICNHSDVKSEQRALTALHELEDFSKALEAKRRGHPQRSLSSIQLRLGCQMDENLLRQQLLDCGVLQGKDYLKWNFSLIHQLLTGPLLLPKRMEETIKSTKFIKRLLSFFRPHKQLFCRLTLTVSNQDYLECGKALFHALTASNEGVRYLGDNRFLYELHDALESLDPMRLSNTASSSTLSSSAGNEAPGLFSQESVATTLSLEYFTLLGYLHSLPNGIRLMHRARLFTPLYRLTELRSREDLIQKMITSFDYELDSQMRLILSRVMTAAAKPMRLFSTRHMQCFTRQPNTSGWLVPLLVTQLYDPSHEVQEESRKILESWLVQDVTALDQFIACQPSLRHLEQVELLKSLCLTSLSGWQWLDETWIEEEMHRWWHSEQFVHVQKVSLTAKNAVLPPHFFGLLASTQRGVQMMIPYLTKALKFASLSNENENEIRAYLWTLGHVASTEKGFLYLKDQLHVIVEYSETVSCATLKGTVLYVLSLIGKTDLGRVWLSQRGWQCSSHGIALPVTKRALTAFCKIEFKNTEQENEMDLQTHSHHQTQVLTLIGDLSNHIVASTASKQLAKMKADNPVLFSPMSLYLAVHRIMAYYHYRMPVRRFIQELFDKVDWKDDVSVKLKSGQAAKGSQSTFQSVKKKSSVSNASVGMAQSLKRQSMPPGIIIRGFK